ncbi:MAG: hypothetical protein ACHQF2_01935 [Flavobacteriales bacterium]
MKNIFYLHWDEQELKARIKPLKELGLKIHSHWSTKETAKWGDSLPDIFVVSIDRLPSHGRQYVEWLWEAKKRQHIPVIFVGGQPDKIAQTKSKFPKAIYCTNEQLVEKLNNMLKKVELKKQII